CVTAPTDSRLGSSSGRQICGLYDVNPARLGRVQNVLVLAADVAGTTSRPKEIFNGVDVAVNARFGRKGVLQGGITVGGTTFDYCWQNALPNVTQQGTPANLPRTEGFCHIQSPIWSGVGSQAKLQVVYPLPWEFTVSGTYKDIPGLAITANYVLPNAL